MVEKNLIKSDCPEGYQRIINLYWDPKAKQLVIKTEDNENG